MGGPRSRACWSLCAVVAGLAACVPAGDSGGPRPGDNRATSPPISPAVAPRAEGDESLAALTAEVRQLRLAVEALARAQTETQALQAYMSAQQGRVSQATQALDAARKDLDAATARSRAVQAELTRLSEQLARTTNRNERDALEEAVRGLQAEANNVDLEVQRARSRESDASLALGREEDRWADLLARLQELLR